MLYSLSIMLLKIVSIMKFLFLLQTQIECFTATKAGKSSIKNVSF